MAQHQKLALLIGGRPATGINSVISAATIRGVHVPKTIDNDLDLPPYVDIRIHLQR